MSRTLAAAAILVSLGAPASAHRLDEYLQATIVSVERNRVQAFMRLVPGVAVSPLVIATIDTNANGIISGTERQSYAESVLRDLALSVDGHRLKPRLVSIDFPSPQEMKEGLGEIQIEFTADLPNGSANRTLIFENHHQRRISAYLINSLVPRDKNIQITAQNRNQDQSFYQLNYAQADGHRDPPSRRWWSGIALTLSAGLVLLLRQRAKSRITAVLLVAALAPTVVHAHSMYQSDVKLDFIGGEVHAELQLPLERIETVCGTDRTSLTAFIIGRFHARTTDGRAFQTSSESPLTTTAVDGAPYLVARLVLKPPAQSQPEFFELEDDVILDSMPSQVALVSIRSDWSTSVFANDPQLVGVLRSNARSLMVDRTGRSWFRGFASLFRLGMRHIAEGTDHLLFILTLLLPAPLLVLGSRWAGFAGVRQSWLQILKVVTAFTVGHSITLALAALGLFRVPSRLIEVLIAVSILVSAAHALRPLFPAREALIAAFFGLIHGLAFATTLGELGLGRWERVAGILGFNLGIETMQLIVVAATMPSLVLLSRTHAYPVVRIGGALVAGVASTGWIVERLLETHSWVDVVVDTFAHHAVWVAVVMFLTSLVCCPAITSRLKRRDAPASAAGNGPDSAICS